MNKYLFLFVLFITTNVFATEWAEDFKDKVPLPVPRRTTCITLRANLPKDTFIACSTKSIAITIVTPKGDNETLTFDFIRKSMEPIQWGMRVSSTKSLVLNEKSSQPYCLSILFNPHGYPVKFNNGAFPLDLKCQGKGGIYYIKLCLGDASTSSGLTCKEGRLNARLTHDGKAAEPIWASKSNRVSLPKQIIHSPGGIPIGCVPLPSQSNRYDLSPQVSHEEYSCCTIL